MRVYEEIRKKIICETRERRSSLKFRGERSRHFSEMKEMLETLQDLPEKQLKDIMYIFDTETKYLPFSIYFSYISKTIKKVERYYDNGLNDKTYSKEKEAYRNAHNRLKRYSKETPPL